MDTKTQGIVAELQAQRNSALDSLAAANGVVAELREQLEAALKAPEKKPKAAKE